MDNLQDALKSRWFDGETKVEDYPIIVRLKKQNVLEVAEEIRLQYSHLKRGYIGLPGDYLISWGFDIGTDLYLLFRERFMDDALHANMRYGETLLKIWS